MSQVLGLVSVVVHDYDEALSYYVGVLGFDLVEDTLISEQSKRWVVVRPPGSGHGGILLARAANEEQASRVGNQTGGRVFLFLYTDDFERDYAAYEKKGVVFAPPTGDALRDRRSISRHIRQPVGPPRTERRVVFGIRRSTLIQGHHMPLSRPPLAVPSLQFRQLFASKPDPPAEV